ncbi:hypothetical protein LRAMOSA02716 [Lichtheimia ramosa]|uniref:Uncharacterized protein n=1 Tax=Lichtheimia ramosa TaxID=688394 RepID=A0A077WS57_9FUNG|nr:hypothetical protein LRAMOSA02716 [Lichtheimia ramosa]
MTQLLHATSLSNWTLSLVLGAAAALRSGSQAGYVDELPFCDVLLTFTNRLIENGLSGTNVVIGLDTRWIRMMIMSFHTRRMPYSYILLDGKTFVPKCINHGDPQDHFPDGRCLMTPEPRCPILPNMFYSLVTDYHHTDGKAFKAVHRPECILRQEIDGRAIEFLSDDLTQRLRGVTNLQALELCANMIDSMCDKVMKSSDTNEWDRRIIDRIRLLTFQSDDCILSLLRKDTMHPSELIEQLSASDDDKDQEDATRRNETMDRIHSRIPAMLERLKLNTFDVLGESKPYSIYDVSRAFIIYFGIVRAVKMSRRIYEEQALVAMGYNIAVAHELISDVSDLPAPLQVGYSSGLVIESTSRSRLADIQPKDVHIFYTLFLELMISIGIMFLSGMGPITCMYVGRLLTARYRGSALKMGTSLNWSVGRVQLAFTGSARDDWMVCITPVKNRTCRIVLFTLLVYLASLVPIAVWPLIHSPFSEINALGSSICYISFFFGILWLLATESMQEHAQGLRSLACSILVALLPLSVFMGWQQEWIYLYLFEFLYGLQWVYGAINEKWLYQGSALFMLGVLGALRLSNLVDIHW